MKKIYILSILLLINTIIFCQSDSSLTALWDMSLEELMNVDVKIASVSKSYSIKEAPAVVTVISEQEIKSSGARDLIDILRIIPGFDFGTDVNGVVSIIYRGMWVQEGKALLMIDDQVVNELMYSCNFLGNNIPVENIKRIEILRGPGSATYGDCAEMVVISIITNDYKSKKINLGAYVSGVENKIPFRQNLFLEAGNKFKDMEIGLFFRYSDAARANFEYTDNNGNSYNLVENKINSLHSNFKIAYKNLSFNTIINKYQLNYRDAFGTNLSRPYKNNFDTYLSNISYSPNLSDNFRILNNLSFKYDNPWNHEDINISPEDINTFSNLNFYAIRIKAKSLIVFEKEKIITSIGAEYVYDYSKTKYDYYWNGKQSINYNTISGIAQLSYNTKFLIFIAETRFDKHNLYGGVFAPRISLTKDFGYFNYKILWNRAFRAPSIDDFNLNYSLYPNLEKPQIKPEFAEVYNMQIGTVIAKKLSIDAGVFYSSIKNPIIYIYSNNSEGYDNYKKTGSNGFETEISLKLRKLFVRVSYSYYSSVDFITSKPINEVPDYFVYNNNDTLHSILLGSPQHKMFSSISYDFNKNLMINFSTVYTSFKYAYIFNKKNNIVELSKLPSLVLSNIILTYRNILKNTTLQFGVYNLLNSKNYFVQPYNGGHTPLLDTGREFLIKLQYSL